LLSLGYLGLYLTVYGQNFVPRGDQDGLSPSKN
jgi:hypothetical protein